MRSARKAFEHPVFGVPLKLVVAYLLLMEGLVQIIFGRLDLGFIELGLRDQAVPHAIYLNGASVGLLYGLLGMGLVLIYRGSRIINFAQAQLGSVPAVTALLLMLRKDVNYFLVIPMLIAGAVILGAAVEILIVRRFRDAPRLILTVATIGVSLLLLALEYQVQVWITGDAVSSSTFTTPWTDRLGFDIHPLRFTGDFVIAPIVAIVSVRRTRGVLPLHRHGHRRTGLGRERRTGLPPRHPGRPGVDGGLGARRSAVGDAPCSSGRR